MMKKYTKFSDLEPVFSGRIHMTTCTLKQRLISLNIKKRECEHCGITQWCNKEAPLELHHIDGNSHNNAYNNLKILCSNCHAQTHTFCQTKKAKINLALLESVKDIVPHCYTFQEVFQKLEIPYRGFTYLKIRKYIKEHNIQLKTRPKVEKVLVIKNDQTNLEKLVPLKVKKPPLAKSNWYPSNQELFEAVWSRSVLDLSKSLGVTSNAIKHRCKRRGIPVPPPGYWAKLKHGKIEECLRIKEDIINKSGWVQTNSPPGV